MGKKGKIIMGLAVGAMIPAILTGCGHKEHEPKDEWKTDATHHWHECEGEKCDEQLNKAEHEATGNWLTSDTHHWKDCDDCGYDVSYAAHTFDQEVVSDNYLKTAATETTKAVYFKSCVCGTKGTETFEADKIATTITNIQNLNKTYDGVAVTNTPTFDKNSNATATIEYFVKGQTTALLSAPVNAGEYTVKVSIPETTTHTATSVSQDFTIAPIVIDNKNFEFEYIPSSPTFRGVAIPPSLLAECDATRKLYVVIYFDSNNAGASITGKGVFEEDGSVPETNYVVGNNVTASIIKATPQIDNLAVSENIVYGSDFVVNYSATEGLDTKVEYKVNGQYTQSKPVDAGEYSVRVTVIGNQNYESISQEINFTIAKQQLTNLGTAYVPYNGTNVHIIDLEMIEYGLALEVTFNQTAVDGSHPTGVKVLMDGVEAKNYYFDTSDSSSTVEMVAKEIGIDWTAPINLKYDGTEKTPTASATGLIAGDTCNIDIMKFTGDNVMFGDDFTFIATNLDNSNYKLPDEDSAKTSPQYAITIESANVDEPVSIYVEDQGSDYFTISLVEDNFYYFTFEPANQGEAFELTLYRKSDQTEIVTKEVVWTDAVTCTIDETPFLIQESGEYYVKYTGKSDGFDGGDVTIHLDDHSTLNEQGFCLKGCGSYCGDIDFAVNGWETVEIKAGEKLYYRFADAEDNTYVQYNIAFNGSAENVEVKVYAAKNDGTFEDLELTTTAEDVVASYDDYYYVVVTATADTTVTFQIEQTFTD